MQKEHELYQEISKKRRDVLSEYHHALTDLHNEFLERLKKIQDDFELAIRQNADETFFVLSDTNPAEIEKLVKP